MRELNLDQLRTLVTIADLGSFAAAARSLHLAAPTISLHVAELESRLGAPLLLRQRQRVVPTGVGARLIERARRLLADVDAAVDEVARQVEGRAGRVRLGASTGALAWLLPQALEAMGREHPGIDVQVAVLTSQEALSRLQEGTLDIGLVALPQAAVKGLQIMPWRRDPVLAFLPKSWTVPRTITPGWLAARPLILNDASTRLHRMTMDWFAAAGEQPQARIASTKASAFFATISARSSLISPAIGSSTSASTLPSETTMAPPPTSPSRFAASAISARLVPTTIIWWLSCATVEATAQGRL